MANDKCMRDFMLWVFFLSVVRASPDKVMWLELCKLKFVSQECLNIRLGPREEFEFFVWTHICLVYQVIRGT